MMPAYFSPAPYSPIYSYPMGYYGQPTGYGWNPMLQTVVPPQMIHRPAPKTFSQVRASHILVKTRDHAERLREEILSGQKTFAQAAQVSECPSKRKGGDLGYFGRDEMAKEFERVAFTLPKGALSRPVQTDFGWHLIWVRDKR